MLPASKNLSVYQGDSFIVPIRLRAITSSGSPGAYHNLTGCTALAQVRVAEESGVLTTFTATIDNQTTNLGGVTLSLSPAQTLTLVNAKWDLQITYPDGFVRTYIAGNITVTKEISRA